MGLGYQKHMVDILYDTKTILLSIYNMICIKAPLTDINNVYCNTSNTSVNTNGKHKLQNYDKLF